MRVHAADRQVAACPCHSWSAAMKGVRAGRRGTPRRRCAEWAADGPAPPSRSTRQLRRPRPPRPPTTRRYVESGPRIIRSTATRHRQPPSCSRLRPSWQAAGSGRRGYRADRNRPERMAAESDAAATYSDHATSLPRFVRISTPTVTPGGNGFWFLDRKSDTVLLVARERPNGRDREGRA